MKLITAPHIPEIITDYLNMVFPERVPNAKDTEREIWMKAGERRLITWLEAQQQQQNEETGLPNVRF